MRKIFIKQENNNVCDKKIITAKYASLINAGNGKQNMFCLNVENIKNVSVNMQFKACILTTKLSAERM